MVRFADNVDLFQLKLKFISIYYPFENHPKINCIYDVLEFLENS